MKRDHSSIHLLHIPLSFAIDSTNSYFCADPVPTLIDVPPAERSAQQYLEASLAAIGYSVGDIGRIIITHPHLDHYGSAAWIRAKSGAEVWALKDAANRLEESHGEMEKDFSYYCRFIEWAGAPKPGKEYLGAFFEAAERLGPAVEVARRLEEGERIRIGSARYTVMCVPGHTPWCTLYYDPKTASGFTGDFLIRDISSNAVVRRPLKAGERYRSLEMYSASLREMKALGLRKAFPGHGDIIGDAGARIDEVLRSILGRQRQICAALKEGPSTPYGIMDRIFSNLPDFHVLLGISEVVGHLEVLESQGAVERERGTSLYHVVHLPRP